MGYEFFLGRLQLPVPPAKLSTKIKGKNQTVTLIGEGEINLLKLPGLTEISFTALLPAVEYPFAFGDSTAAILAYLERVKTRRLAFRLLVSRGELDTDMRVALEDYTLVEDAENGADFQVEITLRQYRDWGTKTIEITPEGAASAEEKRPVENPPAKESHTVVKGDCLWNLAQAYLGDGSRYPELYAVNQAVIDGKNKGTGNTKYTIYPGQELRLTG